jgi:hypothetical protein
VEVEAEAEVEGIGVVLDGTRDEEGLGVRVEIDGANGVVIEGLTRPGSAPDDRVSSGFIQYRSS